jgi:hypothetical protein
MKTILLFQDSAPRLFAVDLRSAATALVTMRKITSKPSRNRNACPQLQLSLQAGTR